MFDSSFNREVAQAFTTSVIRDLARTRASKHLRYIVANADNRASRNMTLSAMFEQFYNHLLENYRAEYIFKNSIARTLLLERHRLDEATLLSEFPVGSSKADAVILNGTSTVYEIKTALDNLDRLPAQLKSYDGVFEHIVVVTEVDEADKVVAKVPEHIGIVLLTDTGALVEARPPQSNLDNVNSDAIFHTMRQAEYTEALMESVGYIPNVPNTLMYRECRKLFASLDSREAHNLMVRLLRESRSIAHQAPLKSHLPPSITFLSLTMRLTKAEQVALRVAMSQPISG